MKPIKLSCFLLLFIIAIFADVSADIHAILVGDTVSPTGKAARLDLNRLEAELNIISRNTEARVTFTTLTDVHVTSGHILEAVKRLQCTSDDTVIFYYVGHGYRTSAKKTTWPFLYLCTENEGFDFSIVVDSIIAKKPRMALIVADCCNNVMDDDFTVPWENHIDLKRSKSSRLQGYKSLFQDYKGIIIACGSREGEYAYCHQFGHFYTGALLKAIHNEVYSKYPQWSNLLENASKNVKHIQNAYYELMY
jgi:hypothetical protein